MVAHHMFEGFKLNGQQQHPTPGGLSGTAPCNMRWRRPQRPPAIRAPACTRADLAVGKGMAGKAVCWKHRWTYAMGQPVSWGVMQEFTSSDEAPLTGCPMGHASTHHYLLAVTQLRPAAPWLNLTLFLHASVGHPPAHCPQTHRMQHITHPHTRTHAQAHLARWRGVQLPRRPQHPACNHVDSCTTPSWLECSDGVTSQQVLPESLLEVEARQLEVMHWGKPAWQGVPHRQAVS